MSNNIEEREEELILRDRLAIDRTALANERNLLAFVRTSVAFIAGGFGLLKLFEGSVPLIVIGWILIALGVGILVIGIIRFIKFQRKINKIGGQFYNPIGRTRKDRYE